MNNYMIIVYDDLAKTQPVIYKIPAGQVVSSGYTSAQAHICLNTFYSQKRLPHNDQRLKHNVLATAGRFIAFKPIYYSKFTYLGKGFKLVLKKRKGFFNCLFGHSHVYWLKVQKLYVKKTKKYRFFFATTKPALFWTAIQLLKRIKPINRYTLRGVRTYAHVWVKRKGRKSIATHF
jgi:hypothetical protein